METRILPNLTNNDKHRFLNKVNRKSNKECWIWQASLHRQGYGQFNVEGKIYKAHRIAYFIHYGINTNQDILHSCDNPSCCNPEHLFIGNQDSNMKDCASKGRIVGYKSGEDNINAKLTWEIVREIRRKAAFGITLRSLAKEYFVDFTVVGKIIRNEIWKE